MASDEKILQYKDLKNYNNRVKQYVDENAGSGGSTTLADLGITVSAAQINDLKNISDYTMLYYDRNVRDKNIYYFLSSKLPWMWYIAKIH